MAVSRKKLPKELRKPRLASVVLEVSSKSGAPMTAKEKLRLRQAVRQFAREALKYRSFIQPMSNNGNGDGQKQRDD